MAKKQKRHPSGARKRQSKSHSSKALVFVLLVAVVIGVILLVSKSGEMRGVAATVNGEEITTAYLEEQYSRIPLEYQGFITKEVLLNQTINEVLLLQEAEKQGIEVTEEDVQKEIDAAMETAGVTEEQLEQRLAEQNITMEYLEDLYTKQLTINSLLEETIFSEIEVTDSEIDAFYDSRVRAMHILLETEEEALEVIEDLKKVSLNAIESRFSEIAKEKSIDPSAATNAGDLGEFGRGQMVPEFEKAAFALDEYAFTAKPVQSQFGYHIILKLPKQQTLEEQYAAIGDALLSQKKAQAVPIYLEQMRSKADVEIFFEEEAPTPVPQELVTVAPVVPEEEPQE
ncbi:peptidylprolyl isomerase [Candidatus Woesearchaeota archaeon]|nr:peptidylprolyl isomerase [Candidatus Woesearchaeota archaeon]